MIGYKAYQVYNAIMLHFNDKTHYDYFKYNGRTRVNEDTFHKNKQNVFKFAGIEKRVGIDELETFFFVTLEKDHFIRFVPQVWYKNYKQKLDVLNRFETIFERDIKNVKSFLDTPTGYEYHHLFNESDYYLHPMLYKLSKDGHISPLSMIFVDLYIHKYITEESSSDPLQWKEVVEQHHKRVGFYRRCYFHRLQSKDEMINNWTKAFKQV